MHPVFGSWDSMARFGILSCTCLLLLVFYQECGHAFLVPSNPLTKGSFGARSSLRTLCLGRKQAIRPSPLRVNAQAEVKQCGTIQSLPCLASTDKDTRVRVSEIISQGTILCSRAQHSPSVAYAGHHNVITARGCRPPAHEADNVLYVVFGNLRACIFRAPAPCHKNVLYSRNALLAGSIADLFIQQAQEAVADVSMHFGRDVEKVRITTSMPHDDTTITTQNRDIDRRISYPIRHHGAITR